MRNPSIISAERYLFPLFICCAAAVVVVALTGMLALSQVRDDFSQATEAVGDLWEGQQVVTLRAAKMKKVVQTVMECDDLKVLNTIRDSIAYERKIVRDPAMARWLGMMEDRVIPARAMILDRVRGTGKKIMQLKNAMNALMCIMVDQLDYFEEEARNATSEVETATSEILARGSSSMAKWMWGVVIVGMLSLFVLVAGGMVAVRRITHSMKHTVDLVDFLSRKDSGQMAYGGEGHGLAGPGADPAAAGSGRSKTADGSKKTPVGSARNR